LCRGKFAALAHFFGYEGRCSLPSNFDATYCNALGQAAGALVASGRTGLMATGEKGGPPALSCGAAVCRLLLQLTALV